MLAHQTLELCFVGTHHFCDLSPVLVEFKGWHGLDFLIGSDVFGLVHVALAKDNLRIFLLLGQLFKLRANESTGTACDITYYVGGEKI